MSDDYSDPAAESTVMAAVLSQPSLVESVLTLGADAFTNSTMRLIFDAVAAVARSGEPLEHATIARRAAAQSESRGQSTLVMKAVMDMAGRGGDYAVGYYIDRLVYLRSARDAQSVSLRLQQRVDEAVRLEDPTLLESAAKIAREELDGMSGSNTASDDDLPMSLAQLLDRKYSHNWLIPELLEATDRLVLTGYEGTGKSILVAQMVMSIAAGIHPFLGVQVADPVQTLVIDAENSERQTARRYRGIQQQITKLCGDLGIATPDWGRQVRFVIRPEGIELNDPRTIRSIEKAIAATKPRFVAMGPLYRLHKLDTRDEQAAKELTDVIDRLRVKYQFALVAEAHVAHGAPGSQRLLRPTGSSLFLRWPEFGLGLRPAEGTEGQEHPNLVDVVSWRGGREERMWPRQLQHSHKLPWGNGDPNYYNTAREMGLMA